MSAALKAIVGLAIMAAAWVLPPAASSAAAIPTGYIDKILK